MTNLSLFEQLALDEALLLQAEEKGGECLRLWESPTYAVVLGAGGKVQEDVEVAACQAEGIPILRRASGGGTVLLGPGCLLYSLVLTMERDPALGQVVTSYRWIMERIARALTSLAPDLRLEGTSDLAIDGRKISGNSQQRKRRHVLHHGTILYDFDLERIPRLLRLPDRQPDYRQGRSHRDFVTNLPTPRPALEERIHREWSDVNRIEVVDEEVLTRARQLVLEKYERPDWIFRR